jgi:regulator of protease activity HflC (stomatin/prohibitin superfamily)
MLLSPGLITVIVIAVLVLILIYASIRILREYERGVVFTLGRYTGTKGPGLFLLVPFVQQMVRVDLRVIVDEVPPQDVISRDNVSVKVSAVIYFRVVDAERAIIQVSNYLAATSQLAQTTLRWVLGKHDLDQMLAERDKLNATSRTSSTSRPKAGASRSPLWNSSASISTRA